MTRGRKRAPLPLQVEHAKQFRKDWERLDRSGRYDMVALREVMILIASDDGPLPAERRDHALTGQWREHRECHVGGDFLLIYRIANHTVTFVRAGTHAELFE